jgi:hypothetical protein
MSQETDFVVEDGVVVPQSAALRRAHPSEHTNVPGLEDEEAADPDELERQIYREHFELVLALPEQPATGPGYRIWDDGSVGFGAYGSIDFERLRPKFDKARYKAAKLREELRDLVIRLGLISERLPSRGKGLVLKYVRMGMLEPEHIVHEDMRIMVRLYLRARRLRQEIQELEESSRKRRRNERAERLASVGD